MKTTKMTEGEKLIWAAAFALESPGGVKGVVTAANHAFNVVLSARAQREDCKYGLEPFAYEMFCEVTGYVDEEDNDDDE